MVITFATNGHVGPKVSLQATQRAMQELIIPGKTPNGKLAFWNAALSIQCPLEVNGKRAQAMHQYINASLPQDREVLRSQLYVPSKGKLRGGKPMYSVINTLYEIERLWNDGTIHFNTGNTFTSQALWRLQMVAAIPGMGCKTVSFALHIFNPFGCQILTLDRWHFRRLGEKEDSVPTAKYLKLEARLFELCYELALTDDRFYSPIVLAACLWEDIRQAYGASDALDGEYQSHACLSCYV